MAYAERTEVPVERSRNEVERILEKFGAKERGVIVGEREAHVFFLLRKRRVLFKVPMPDEKWAPSSGAYSSRRLAEARDQERRRRWRALTLVIKAKLESVSSGIEMFEDAFLAQIVLPNGRTVAEEVRKPIAHAYETGQVAPLLGEWIPAPALGSGTKGGE